MKGTQHVRLEDQFNDLRGQTGMCVGDVPFLIPTHRRGQRTPAQKTCAKIMALRMIGLDGRADNLEEVAERQRETNEPSLVHLLDEAERGVDLSILERSPFDDDEEVIEALRKHRQDTY